MNKNWIICTGCDSILQHVSVPPCSLIQSFQRAKKGKEWCLKTVEAPDDGSIIAQAVLHGEAMAVSDGSFKNHYGMAAWVIEGSDQQGRISGKVI
jgi:hypothetical protein